MSKFLICIKYALYVYNLLVIILGLLAVIFAFSRTFHYSPYWLWFIPLTLFCLAGLGVYGTYAEKTILLLVFFALTWIIIFITVGFAIFFIVIFRLDVKSLTTADDAHPFIVMLGVLFGTAAFMLLGGILSMIMVIQVKESSNTQ